MIIKYENFGKTYEKDKYIRIENHELTTTINIIIENINKCCVVTTQCLEKDEA